ncbi:MAG: hypothetical protein H6741_18160 [Alphaproteobacteria bacterium]|nr:hypothetical protein [Alphaproteobacteria bacterium]
MPCTVSSSDDYIIVVNDDNTANVTEELFIYKDAGATGVFFIPGSVTSTYVGDPGELHWSTVPDPPMLLRAGGHEFFSPAGDPAVEFYSIGPQLEARVDSYGVMDLTNAGLRLPIVTTLPSSPETGEVILYDTGSALRIAAYINGGWRESDDFS